MILRGVISAILLIALTLSSFGHRSLSLTDEMQAQSYLLAGGDWDELCGDADDPLAHVTKCIACVLAQTCALPAPAGATHITAASTVLVWPTQRDAYRAMQALRFHPARAPPFV